MSFLAALLREVKASPPSPRSRGESGGNGADEHHLTLSFAEFHDGLEPLLEAVKAGARAVYTLACLVDSILETEEILDDEAAVTALARSAKAGKRPRPAREAFPELRR